MATIFYGVMGEGRGHAARARAMTERLRGRHRIVIYTSYDALEFLRSVYADDPDVDIRETDGLRFQYSGDRLNVPKTVAAGLKLWWNVGDVVRNRQEEIKAERPALVITDFEPTLARAANRSGVPLLSLDHQHFLLAYDLRELPRRLRRWAWVMGLGVRAFGIKPKTTAVSAFYRPPLKAGYQDVMQVGPLLRPAVRERQVANEGHVLSYLRRVTPPRVIDMLERLGHPVRVYGLGERPARGAVTFHAVDEQPFAADLASCDAVIAAAGNQLLGEALHFGKPVFALPEHKHHEQCINAWFLDRIGGGAWAPLESVSEDQLLDFWRRRDEYRERLATCRDDFDGTDAAADIIEQMIADK